MNGSEELSRQELLDAAIALLRGRLPSSWTVDKARPDDADDLDLLIRTPSSTQQLVLVEARSEVTSRDVQLLLGGPWRRWRKQTGNPSILLIAPYLSPRVRELLTEENVSYLDLTGNVRLDLDYPGVFVLMDGAQRDARTGKPRNSLRGAKVGAVVRVLADAAPPYTATEVARAAGVNEGYLSRILETLTEEGLIDRRSFGPITRVDWPTMLHRRARALDLFRPSGTFRYVARQGPTALLDNLRSRRSDRPPTVTGSYAASRLAPVAAPSLLVLYTPTPRELATELKLLPSDAGADTILIRPENDVVAARSAQDGGIAWAAPSQVAIDCLAGSGRMPSEGEALIEWMRKHETSWRYPSISALFSADDQEETE